MNARRIIPLVVASLLAGGCALQPGEPDPTELRLVAIEQRLDRLERALSGEGFAALQRDVATGSADLRTLRGQVEQLQFEASGSAERQRALLADIDARIARLEQGATAAVATAAGDERTDYAKAFDLMKTGQYEQAITAWGAFLRAHPQGELAGNAEYWLGEAHYVRKDYPSALAAFNLVLKREPPSGKAPDALLKRGYCEYELKRYAEARATLTRVGRDYAGTPAAQEAAARLKRMGTEGR